MRNIYSQLDQDQDMIDPLQFGMFLVDWTDARKLVDQCIVFLDLIPDLHELTMVQFYRSSLNDGSPNSHTSIALNILKTLYDPERDGTPVTMGYTSCSKVTTGR